MAARVAGRSAASRAALRTLNGMEDRRFQAAEAKIIRPPQPGTRQFIIGVIAWLPISGYLLNRRPARIAQAKNTRYLIECLASGIVACTAQQFIVTMPTNQHQLRMRARHDQTQHREARVALPIVAPGIRSRTRK